MHVVKRFTHDLIVYEPTLLLGHLQPQPHLMVTISTPSNRVTYPGLYLLLYQFHIKAAVTARNICNPVWSSAVLNCESWLES